MPEPLDPRAAVVNALIDHGGDYLEPGLPEVIAALWVGTTNEDGSDVNVSTLPLPRIWDELAKRPTELSRVIAEAKAAMPAQFIDVSRFDRIKSPSNRFVEKMQAIARARDSRVSVGRLQAEMLGRRPSAVGRRPTK